jgi:putative nucleotidyltransferase with HDIG domain
MATTRFRDLPRRTQVYVGTIALAGAGTVAESFLTLYQHPIGWTWTILALLTLVSGSATVNLPGMPATVSVSETFVFTSVLLFGSAAGTLTVALDALVISFWSFRRGHAHYKILFNVCAVPLTLWVASHLYYGLSPYGPLYFFGQPIKIQLLLLPLLAFTVAYYCVNTWIITVAIALEKQLSPLKIWRENFIWLALNYFGGASVAALLVSYTHDLDYTFLLIIVPLLVVLYFTFATSMGRVEDSNKHLGELNRLYMSTIETLAMAIDAKDQITHGHIRRVQVYAVGLAKCMGVKEESQIRAIEAAALLHDMGKLAVPEYILNKPGPLTPAEFEKMKLHASVGADILSAIEFPYPVVPIVRHHHENWDGTGYPDGVKGADIPIGARILSVVDCFDALTSDRPYRPRLSTKEALKILRERRGTMYDPLVVDVFFEVHTTIAPPSDAQHEEPALKAITAASANPPESYAQNRLDEISASSDEMLTLFELARSLNSSMDFREATELVSSHLRRLVPSSLSVFFLYDESADELVAAHAIGEHAGLITGLRIVIGQRLSGWVAANRQSIRNSDPMLDLGDAARATSPRLRSTLSTALVSADRLVGVVSLYSSKTEAFSDEHQRILEVIASQISIALCEISSTQMQKNVTLIDSAPALPGVTHLTELLRSYAKGHQSERAVGVLLVTAPSRSRHGESEHKILTESVRRALRSGDLLFSVEGYKLAVVLLDTERRTAELLRKRVEANISSTSPHQSEFSVVLYYGVTGNKTLEDLFVALHSDFSDGTNSQSVH